MTVAALLNSLAAASSMTNVISGSFSAINVALNTLTQALKEGFGNAADFAKEKFGQFTDWFNGTVVPIFQPYVSAATTAITTIIDIWKGSFSILFDLFTGDFDGAMQTATNLFNQYMLPLFETLSSAAGTAVGFIQSALEGAWNYVANAFNENVISPISGLIETFTNAGNLIANNWDLVVTTIRNAITEKIEEATGFIETRFASAVEAVTGEVEAIKTSIETKIGNAIDFVTGKFAGLWPSLTEGFNQNVVPLFNTIKNIDPFAALSASFEVAGNAIDSIHQTLVQPVIDALSGADLQDVIDMLDDLVGAAEKVVGGAVGKVAGFVSGGVGKIGSLFGGGGGDDDAQEQVNTNINEGGSTVNNTFNITMEVGGVTDRTDKRSLAEEIGAMIQEELSRNTNTTSYSITGR